MPEELTPERAEEATEQELFTEEATDQAEATADDGETDYASIVEEDLTSLRSEFPELRGINSILELRNPVRYGALRDLGLTPAEAYLATEGRSVRKDNRSHLVSSVPKSTARPMTDIPKRELEIARELFSDLSDREIHKLYRKVKG